LFGDLIGIFVSILLAYLYFSWNIYSKML
jgi:hypothetical protein